MFEYESTQSLKRRPFVQRDKLRTNSGIANTFSLLKKDDTFEMQLILEIWKSPWKLTTFLLSRAQALDR